MIQLANGGVKIGGIYTKNVARDHDGTPKLMIGIWDGDFDSTTLDLKELMELRRVLTDKIIEFKLEQK